MEQLNNFTKYKALDIISSMPEGATLEDIFYRLYLVNKIESGLNDIKKSEIVSNETITEELSRWLS